MEDCNYLIYKHTSPSGKAYIGQTNNLSMRNSNHRKKGGCRAFFSAINKYGWDNFKHEVLMENLTIDDANKYEIELIARNNTLHPNGYNLVTGGLNRVPCE